MSSPDTHHYDVIVAGVGTMGSAACFHLAERGAKVLGLERFEIPHANGSHHGRSRMIRKAYFEHPDYVPLLRRAFTLWDELQSEAADHFHLPQFFYRTGGLYIGSESGTILPGSLHAAQKHDLPHAKLTPREVSERFPPFKVDPAHSAFYERDAGFLIPELAVEAHARLAARLGADLHPNEPLESFQTHQTGVTVRTGSATYTSDHLILTSGAWTGSVARDLGIPLQVTRQVLAWFEPKGDPARFAPDVFPCWFVEDDPPFGHYGFPYQSGDPGLKIALHKPGNPIAPDDLHSQSLSPTESEIASLRNAFDTHLPGAVGSPAKAATCLYTNSPDGHFILGRHPTESNLTIASGFSGHGFKFATVMGEALADLALSNATDLPVGFLSPMRSRPGDP